MENFGISQHDKEKASYLSLVNDAYELLTNEEKMNILQIINDAIIRAKNKKEK